MAKSAPKLAGKRLRFVQEYLVDLNGAAAYKRAGYQASGNAAETGASRMLRNAQVKAAIHAAMDERAQKAGLSAEAVLAELRKMAFANMLDYITTQSDGTAVVDLSKLTRDQAAAIQEVTAETYEERGSRKDDVRPVKRVKFKLADKRGSLELLGKHLKLFKEQVEHSGEVTTGFSKDAKGERDFARRTAFVLAKGLKADKELKENDA